MKWLLFAILIVIFTGYLCLEMWYAAQPDVVPAALQMGDPLCKQCDADGCSEVDCQEFD